MHRRARLVRRKDSTSACWGWRAGLPAIARIAVQGSRRWVFSHADPTRSHLPRLSHRLLPALPAACRPSGGCFSGAWGGCRPPGAVFGPANLCCRRTPTNMHLRIGRVGWMGVAGLLPTFRGRPAHHSSGTAAAGLAPPLITELACPKTGERRARRGRRRRHFGTCPAAFLQARPIRGGFGQILGLDRTWAVPRQFSPEIGQFRATGQIRLNLDQCGRLRPHDSGHRLAVQGDVLGVGMLCPVLA